MDSTGNLQPVGALVPYISPLPPISVEETEFDILVKSLTNATTSRVAGLYYAEDPDASGEKPKPHVSASPEKKAASSVPQGRIIDWGVSVRSAQSRQQFNVVVFGDRGSGKSTLTVRFIRDIYIENYDPTIEGAWSPIQMMVDDELSSLDVLDTTGTEQFTSLNEMYIKAGHGFVLVFSLAQQSSLKQVNYLRKQIYQVKASETVPIVVAATESDHASEREVPASTLESLANEWNIPFYETSAKRNWNVKDVFEDLVRQMRVQYPRKKQKKPPQGSCIIM
ncbi:P-loop containing nucleoside triphosphate hydrolase protein [Mycena galopus ATCC 62051]|nr:P-loop containing nucleoside triphosphate hydrolase protein [Mycena galopus ATCC 62051]